MSDLRLVIRGYYHLEFIIVIKKIVIPRKVFKWEEIGWGEPISFFLVFGGEQCCGWAEKTGGLSCSGSVDG